MCIVVEHARLKQKAAELEARIKELESGKVEFYETQRPSSTQQITYTELYQLLRSYFSNASINLGDSYRFLCNYNDIAIFLAQDQTNKMEYISDTQGISSYDCNIFANRLFGQFSVPGWADLCFGKVWLTVPSHALNLMVTEDRTIVFIEPQNDELLDYTVYDSSQARFIEM